MNQGWNIKKNLCLIMEQFIKVNGKAKIGMDLEYKFGLMELNMKDIGKIIRLMGKESFGMLMETFLMVNGKMIRHMVTEFIFMLMEQNMKENGKMICNMVKEQKFGQMVQDMMDIIRKV